MMASIAYSIENDLGIDEFIDILARSGLAERRPPRARERIEKMLIHANLIVTARREDGLLVGVSRCLTDFSFCCYCSDLAVGADWQGRGIGERLIEESAASAGENAHFFLLSAPKAVGFYEKIGMERHPACFQLVKRTCEADGLHDAG